MGIMRHISIIQHTHSEWLGAIEDHLEGRSIRFGYSRPFVAGGTLPQVPTIGDGLILLGGGPWGAGGRESQLPTLEAEVRLVRACLMLDKPVIGFGLGSQILCLAAEGRVEPAPLTFDVGTARRTLASALGGMLPEAFPHVVYMRDRPVPPDYADILARDAAGNAAVFQIGRRAFGFTSHPGIRRAMIEDLIMEFEAGPDDPGPGLDAIGAVQPRIEDALVAIMAGLVAAVGWHAD